VDAGQEHGVVVGDAAQDDEGVRGLPVELLRDGATDRCGL
jgi:cell shape-determining protein MreC